MTILRDGTPSGEVLRFLQGVTFPAKKDAVVHHLRHAGAPDEIVAMTEQLPGPMFQSADELLGLYGDAE